MHIDQMDLVAAIAREIERQQPGIRVIPRQLNVIIAAADTIVAEFNREEIKAAPDIGIAAWRQTDQVGASSDFMAAQIGYSGIRQYAHPIDPSDFGRCLTLLTAAPELRDRLPEMAKESREWAALVKHWDELENLFREEEPSGKAPKLYDRMRELLLDASG